MLQLFLRRSTHIHTPFSGPLGPKEMSVCGLIQPPVPVLMMASTCCFNVTAGAPSIPHWLWLPSAAGSSPLHTPPSISSAISASFISPHFHLLFLLPLIPISPPPIHLSATLLPTLLIILQQLHCLAYPPILSIFPPNSSSSSSSFFNWTQLACRVS